MRSTSRAFRVTRLASARMAAEQLCQEAGIEMDHGLGARAGDFWRTVVAQAVASTVAGSSETRWSAAESEAPVVARRTMTWSHP